MPEGERARIHSLCLYTEQPTLCLCTRSTLNPINRQPHRAGGSDSDPSSECVMEPLLDHQEVKYVLKEVRMADESASRAPAVIHLTASNAS